MTGDAFDRTERTDPDTSTRDTLESHAYLVRVLSYDAPLGGSARYSLRGVRRILIGRGSDFGAERVTVDGAVELRVRVVDRRMSGEHARIERRGASWHLVDCGSTNGTLLDGERIEEGVVADGSWLQLGHTALLFRDGVASRKVPRDRALRPDGKTPRGLTTLLPSFAEQLERLVRVAASPVTIMLRGETGTGKEVMAKAMHDMSKRPGAFVAVNCGAIPDELIESQLFGHTKGAFSGATREGTGFVRAANYGTLFLDEIGDLPLQSQTALLRVLQENEVVPVGSTRPVPVDIRVISATHQPLEELMDRDAFRRDLFARLAGFVQHIPPLRDRREDVGLLIGELLGSTEGIEPTRTRLRPDAARTLLNYDWPLNVRELAQCLTTAAVLAEDDTISVRDLPEAVRVGPRGPGQRDSMASVPERNSGRRLNDADKALRAEVIEHLQATEGNISEVARRMGKARQQVQRWVKRFNLDPTEFKE